MTYFLLCVFVNVACIGVAWWADLSAQKHIAKGHNEAMKILRGKE
jgi:hypothetical protein